MKKANTVWRHAVEDEFCGPYLEVVGERVIFTLTRGGQYALRAIDSTGRQVWEQQWPEMSGLFRTGAGHVYTGGDQARCISVETGAVTAERHLGDEVDVYIAEPSSVVYRTGKGMVGLHPENLSTLWEWPDEEGAFVPDHGRVCRYSLTDGITIVDVASKAERTIMPERQLSPSAVHAHCGDVWCHFDLTEGHRTGIDLNSGLVVWHESQPVGYGLITVDGERAYSPLEGLAAYDLRTGRQLWHQRLPIVSRAFIWNGRAYVGGYEGWTPIIFVVDGATGELLLKHKVDFKLTGLGHEPSPVVAMGDDRIIVGMRRAILCLELS
ncbi:MAG: hypothetical protein BroJett024_44030 [Alphaproteobacteria bacterium]|nr:MAG: hypothetical protein BroJett024_44030 [Alphaproteobacteria bacterium]